MCYAIRRNAESSERSSRQIFNLRPERRPSVTSGGVLAITGVTYFTSNPVPGNAPACKQSEKKQHWKPRAYLSVQRQRSAVVSAHDQSGVPTHIRRRILIARQCLPSVRLVRITNPTRQWLGIIIITIRETKTKI